MSAPSNQQIIDQYLLDREKIKRIKKAAADALATVEQFQSNRETYLLTQDDPAIVDFFTDIYINGRDGKAEVEAKKKDIGLKQNEIETWLLRMLDKLKSKGMKTAFGTVFPTRKEGVSVDDWDAFLDAEILLPMATALKEAVLSTDFDMEDDASVMNFLRSASHLEFINKGVNKTSVLERMGEKDEKTDSRPNPPPPGVKYTAIRCVGVRKS